MIEEHFKSLGHHNQLTVRFAPAARPNLELKNPTFWDGKMKFQQLTTYGSKGQYIFYAIFTTTVHFPAN